jgi:hypothetical protein
MENIWWKFNENRTDIERAVAIFRKTPKRVSCPYRPNAIRQRDANFQFLKTNKTVNG